MSKKGMGVCYTQNAFGEPLREVTKQERSYIIETYYRPHHEKLTDAVEQELDEDNTALVIDCHSFPNTPLPCNLSQCTSRPDICIGTDSFHTPDKLRDETVAYFEGCDYSVAINNPFAGTLIPMKYYQKDKRVQGIMIEVNRNIYKDNFHLVQKHIYRWLELNYKENKKDQKMTEQSSQISFSPEALGLFKEQVQHLTEQEYNDLAMMVDSKSKEITLEQAEAMLYAAKNPDEVEQMMYGSFIAKTIVNH